MHLCQLRVSDTPLYHAASYHIAFTTLGLPNSPLSLQAWAVGAFAACFAIFNCLPAALELLTLAFVARFSVFSY